MPEMNAVSRFFVNLSASRRARRTLRWLRSGVSVPASARCLELGCGNAAFALRFVDAFHPAEYVATDFDDRQLEEARRSVARVYPGRPPTGLSLRTADMLDLPDDPATFDLVFAFVSIHHTGTSHHDPSQVGRALTGIDRVLRPGGLLVYQEFLHTKLIRSWLAERGYAIEREKRRFRLESVVARKPGH
jgi:ubiquinone/menaquinone biosynthesis C-methylase UbiE